MQNKLFFQRIYFCVSYLLLFLYLLIPVVGKPAEEDLYLVDNQFGSLKVFKKNLEQIGIIYKRLGQDIEITVDASKTLNALPLLLAQGIVSRVDSEIVNIAPLSVSVILAGLSSTITIINSVFERNPSLSKVHIQGFVIPIDNQIKQACYSFSYDRGKFYSMNLDTLTPREFLKVTSDFEFSDWCKENLYQEAANLKNSNK